MDNPVTVSDLESRWRPFTDNEKLVGQTLLEDAWDMVTGPTQLPGLPVDLDTGTVTSRSVISVLSAMVLRVMRNPDGKVSESVDDYSYRRSDAVADGTLYVTDDELARLTPARRVTSVSGAFTIRTTPTVTYPCGY